MDFLDLLCPTGTGVTALVGAGGKTSILDRISREAAVREATLQLTVTTKLQRPCPIEADRIHSGSDFGEPWPRAGERVLWVGEPVAGGKKWSGPELSAIENLIVTRPEFPIFIEADGAACRPVKAPGEGEPVIPAGTDTVAAVIGLSAIGRPIGKDLVHRLDSFLAVSGAQIGDPLGPEHLIKLIAHPKGSFKDCPDSARKIVILNQADTTDNSAAVTVAGEKTAVKPIDERAAGKAFGGEVVECLTEGLIEAGLVGITLVICSIVHNPPIWSIVDL